MLKRIFTATLTVGVLCTLALAAVSLDAHTFLESWSGEVSIGILDSVKALYVLIPLVIAILSRVFLLHDKISDLFGIRRRFDLWYILKPLATGVNFPTTGANWKRIEKNRDLVMRRTFYRYAGFTDPKIDVQLVRTAADRWAWFWCTIEPQIVLIITGSILAWLGAWSWFFGILALMVVLILIDFYFWPQLRSGARNQVAEILNNQTWRKEVCSALRDLAEDGVPAA